MTSGVPPAISHLRQRSDVDADEDTTSFEAALEAGDRAHLLTVGSPARGLCVRVTLGHLDRRGRWHPRLPDIFLIWRGKRV